MEEVLKNKKEILGELKKPYRIRPITTIVVFVVAVFAVMFILGEVKDFERQLTSDFVGALISLSFAWNLGFWLYLGIWQFVNSRKINKVLFPKLEQFIDENEMKSYDEIEAEALELFKAAYTGYTEKYNRLHKMYWNIFKLSFVFIFISLIIELVYSLLT